MTLIHAVEINRAEAEITRAALRMLISASEGTLESIRKLSMRQAGLPPNVERAEIASRRIVHAREMLAKLERI